MRRALPHWRFLAYLVAIPGLALVMALSASGSLDGRRDWPDLLMGGFCLATLLFLRSNLSMMRRAGVADMRRHAADNDAGRRLMPVLLLVLLPLILAYTAWAYWVFRGKVGTSGYH